MFLLSVLGIFFFRQEGVYLIILSSLVMLIATRRRSFLRLAVLAFAGFYLYTQILLPACSVKASNPREVFSIPFQQTARYLRDAGDDANGVDDHVGLGRRRSLRVARDINDRIDVAVGPR